MTSHMDTAGTSNKADREQKILFLARAFMAEDPDSYKSESLKDVCAQLRGASDSFINRSYELYRSDLS